MEFFERYAALSKICAALWPNLHYSCCANSITIVCKLHTISLLYREDDLTRLQFVLTSFVTLCEHGKTVNFRNSHPRVSKACCCSKLRLDVIFAAEYIALRCWSLALRYERVEFWRCACHSGPRLVRNATQWKCECGDQLVSINAYLVLAQLLCISPNQTNRALQGNSFTYSGNSLLIVGILQSQSAPKTHEIDSDDPKEKLPIKIPIYLYIPVVPVYGGRFV